MKRFVYPPQMSAIYSNRTSWYTSSGHRHNGVVFITGEKWRMSLNSRGRCALCRTVIILYAAIHRRVFKTFFCIILTFEWIKNIYLNTQLLFNTYIVSRKEK